MKIVNRTYKVSDEFPTWTKKSMSKITFEEIMYRVRYWCNLQICGKSRSEWETIAESWYPLASRYLSKVVADPRRMNRDNIIAAFAVLSPRKDVAENLRLLIDVIEGNKRKNGLTSNWEKAEQLINLPVDEDPLTIVKGSKVESFYFNLKGDTSYLTLDYLMGEALGLTKIDSPISHDSMEKFKAVFLTLEQEYLLETSSLQNLVWLKYRSYKNGGELDTDMHVFKY